MSGYNRYKENSIYSMSGPELLFLIYDEAIKRLTRAEISLDDKNYADFEDCLLAVCAKANRCDAIVTRNKKDFAGFDIPLLAPEELLAKF